MLKKLVFQVLEVMLSKIRLNFFSFSFSLLDFCVCV